MRKLVYILLLASALSGCSEPPPPADTAPRPGEKGVIKTKVKGGVNN